ncbi:MAG: hypothetical protein ACREIL_00600 [Nitrospiraceae bacterium]
MIRQVVIASVALVALHSPAWGQAVSGVRGISGGVGALHSLTGPTGSFYTDVQGAQGYLYSAGTFESFNFRIPNGPAWSGSMMTLGPRLAVGLVSGGNQSFFSAGTGTVQLFSSPTVIPSPPRELPPLPEIGSSILDEIP